MTIEEATKNLNDVQQRVYRNGSVSKEDSKLWKESSAVIRNAGLKISKHRTFHPEYRFTWYSVNQNTSRRANAVADWVRFTPPCDHKNECTTRAIFFCLDGLLPYDEIRFEQNRKARAIYKRGRCYGWNTSVVWETVLSDRGFVKISLKYEIRRDKLARLLKDCGRILTHSSHHCASVFEGKVYDSWNSSLCKCDYIMVRKEFENKVREIL